MFAAGRDALRDGAVKIVRRPFADAAIAVGRDVGGIDGAERRVER